MKANQIENIWVKRNLKLIHIRTLRVTPFFEGSNFSGEFRFVEFKPSYFQTKKYVQSFKWHPERRNLARAYFCFSPINQKTRKKTMSSFLLGEVAIGDLLGHSPLVDRAVARESRSPSLPYTAPSFFSSRKELVFRNCKKRRGRRRRRASSTCCCCCSRLLSY